MSHKNKWTAALAPLALGALLCTLEATPARADAILTVSDGLNSILVSDNGTGSIIFSSASDPTWNSTDWTINVDLASTEPLIGSTQDPDMHLDVYAVGQGTLTVTFSDDGFTDTGQTNFLTQIGGVLGGGGGSTLTASASSPTLGFDLASLDQVGAGSFSGTFSQPEDVTGPIPYGLELSTTIYSSSYDTTSFDAKVMVPEPGTVALCSAGLLGCLFTRRRRRQTLQTFA